MCDDREEERVPAPSDKPKLDRKSEPDIPVAPFVPPADTANMTAINTQRRMAYGAAL
jgi:hypothetical protein